jgi:hypothetical protein
MKIELIEQTMIYNITVDENEYTLYVSENQNSYCNYELVDSEGSIVDDDDLLEQIMDEISDMPLGFLK